MTAHDSRVYVWLQQLELLQFYPNFMDRGIVFERISDLSEAQLTEIGIHSCTAQQTLLKSLPNLEKRVFLFLFLFLFLYM